LHFTPGAAWKWIELSDLARELRSLSGVIGSAAAPGRRQLAGVPRDLDLAIRSWEGDDYVIAINRSPNPVLATVRLRGAPLTSVNRVDQGPVQAPARITGNEFSDWWTGYGVHVYRIR
jgi:hypothetical protein